MVHCLVSSSCRRISSNVNHLPTYIEIRKLRSKYGFIVSLKRTKFEIKEPYQTRMIVSKRSKIFFDVSTGSLRSRRMKLKLFWKIRYMIWITKSFDLLKGPKELVNKSSFSCVWVIELKRKCSSAPLKCNPKIERQISQQLEGSIPS